MSVREFQNFQTIVKGDRFYFRLGGSLLSSTVSPGDSGWLCVRPNSTCFVEFATAPPASSILCTVLELTATGQDQANGLQMTVQLTGLGESRTFQVASPGTDGLPVLAPMSQNASAVQVSSFRGYSNNSVPTYGFEANAFLLKDVLGQFLGLENGDLVYLSTRPAGFNLLYLDGPRDSLRASNVVFRVYSSSASGTRQYLSMSGEPVTGTSRQASWTPVADNAVLCQLRGSQVADSGAAFALGIVASSWLLASDQNLRLVWGVASATQALTPLFATVPSPLELDSLQVWTVQRGISQFRISANLVLQPTYNAPDVTGVPLAFQADPRDRLMLNWGSTNEDAVAICQPSLLFDQAVTSEPTNLPSPPRSLVGKTSGPGCQVVARVGDEPPDSFPNWFPVLEYIENPGAIKMATMSWASGTKRFYVSGQGGTQTISRRVRFLPMADSAVCFVDVQTDTVIPNCGAVRLNLLESNVSAFPIYAAQQNITGQPTCEAYFRQNLVQKDDDGTAWLFDSASCSVQSPRQYYRLSANETVGPVQMNVAAIVVPENLQLILRLVSGAVALFLRPGTYTRASLAVQDTRWPLSGAVQFVAYCSNIAPPQFYVVNSCMGSAASGSEVWKRGGADCNSFFDEQCPNGALKNAAQCGCYQDITWIQSLGLGDTGAKMITAPQCWGRVCPLGAAYRKAIWTVGCGTICSQLLTGSGADWYQSGRQSIACDGNIYNTQPPNEPPIQKGSDPIGWYIAIVVAAVVGLLFLVLFVVFYRRTKANTVAVAVVH